jgi:hypothetical protein
MALTSSLIYDRTDLAEIIPNIWGERYNDYFKANLIGANFFTDRSSELRGGGDTLYTPNIVAFSANAKSQQTAVTLQSAAPTKQTLTVQTHKEVSFLIEDIDAARVKSSYSTLDTLASGAGFEVAEALEQAIFALFSGFSGVVGASTTNLADSEILAAIATLESNKVPGVHTGQVAFFFHPNTFWRQVQALDKFSLAVNSPSNDPTGQKPKGSLYGIPVYTSPNVPNVASTNGRNNALAHKDAIHFATLALGAGGSKGSMVGSAGVRVQANYIPEYLGTLVTADIVYGVVENRDNAGVLIRTHATKA